MRNEAEDQVAVIRALKQGRRFAYFEDVHVVYRVHDQNSSAASSATSLERQLKIYSTAVKGFESLLADLTWNSREARAWAKRLSRLHFWQIGYAILLRNGRSHEALAAFRKGIRIWPWDWRYWKTYCIAAIRQVAARSRCTAGRPPQ
jgi:hypothetical protein